MKIVSLQSFKVKCFECTHLRHFWPEYMCRFVYVLYVCTRNFGSVFPLFLCKQKLFLSSNQYLVTAYVGPFICPYVCMYVYVYCIWRPNALSIHTWPLSHVEIKRKKDTKKNCSILNRLLGKNGQVSVLITAPLANSIAIDTL